MCLQELGDAEIDSSAPILTEYNLHLLIKSPVPFHIFKKRNEDSKLYLKKYF